MSADHALAVIRGSAIGTPRGMTITRHPLSGGMRRTNPKARARSRILEDDELRALWAAAEANGVFGALVRVALLTGQRREKIISMRWEDIVDGEWRVPASDREKNTTGAIVLPQAALDIINAQPRFASNPYVFAGTGGNPIGGTSYRKAKLDKQAEVFGWTLHDLRRTARSLMSRAGVRPDIAERVLGHTIRGVEGVYDRYSYREEKAHALRALAALVDSIANPPGGKVVPPTLALR